MRQTAAISVFGRHGKAGVVAAVLSATDGCRKQCQRQNKVRPVWHRHARHLNGCMRRLHFLDAAHLHGRIQPNPGILVQFAECRGAHVRETRAEGVFVVKNEWHLSFALVEGNRWWRHTNTAAIACCCQAQITEMTVATADACVPGTRRHGCHPCFVLLLC